MASKATGPPVAWPRTGEVSPGATETHGTFTFVQMAG